MHGGTRLITLGTSAGPPPRAHRAQSSNLLIVNETHYVVDAGDGVARRLAKAGINVREIGIVFITHHHDDHTAGLGTLLSIGKMAASAKVKTVVLSHLTHKRDSNYTRWAEEVKKYFSGEVRVAKDLMAF